MPSPVFRCTSASSLLARESHLANASSILRSKYDYELKIVVSDSEWKTLVGTTGYAMAILFYTTTSSLSMMQECTSYPQHCWLQPILDHPSCLVLFHHIDSSMVPIYVFAMPDDVQHVLMVYTNVRGPRYLGFNSNGDLYVAGHASAELIITLINMPDNTSISHPPPVPCKI